MAIRDEDIKQELRDAFDLLDNEKKRYLTAKELRVAIKAFGVKIPQENIDEAFKPGMKEAGTGPANGLSYDAFEKLMKDWIILGLNQENDLKRLFAILDVDNKQKITFENLRRIVQQAGESVDDQDLRDIIEEADLDNDHGLNYNEFVQ